VIDNVPLTSIRVLLHLMQLRLGIIIMNIYKNYQYSIEVKEYDLERSWFLMRLELKRQPRLYAWEVVMPEHIILDSVRLTKYVEQLLNKLIEVSTVETLLVK
jgi:hypothetical protein